MSEQESADMVEDGYTQLKPQLASHLLVPVFLLTILAFPQLAWNVLDIIIIIIIQVSSIIIIQVSSFISKVRSDLFPPFQCLQVPHQQQRAR